ncbi:MAG: hypothetical protein UR12_C0013G0012 [candidate division TM6 bacterium GW2011_GWF2_30_66]|nr:MAG: hypothetical protein UR12_C0013G0012 [candidate division TM6 bacterium GW2011_GWF2_30_66]
MKKKLFNLIIFTVIFFNFKQNCSQTQTLTSKNNIYYEKFKDLLLVINFNHPHYSNIPFLKKLYSPIFKNIVFYGDKPDPNVCRVYTQNGIFMTNILPDVLTRFPQFKGYLILQDDCILNFWNFLSLDQNKIWFSTRFTNNGKTGISVVKLTNGEYVSGFDWGFCWNIGYNFAWWAEGTGLTIIKTMKKAYLNFTKEDKIILEENIGIGNVAANPCDFFYFPSRFREGIIRLSPAFNLVEHEAAIPTMFCSLDLIKNWENLYICQGQGPINSKNYPKELHWAHPVKFSNSNNRAIISEIFNKMLLEQN